MFCSLYSKIFEVVLWMQTVEGVRIIFFKLFMYTHTHTHTVYQTLRKENYHENNVVTIQCYIKTHTRFVIFSCYQIYSCHNGNSCSKI